jgi:hypothetical protein
VERIVRPPGEVKETMLAKLPPAAAAAPRVGRRDWKVSTTQFFNVLEGLRDDPREAARGLTGWIGALRIENHGR